MYTPQQVRTLALTGKVLPVWNGEPVVFPVRLQGIEKLGKLYEYSVKLKTRDTPTLRATAARAMIRPDELVGREVSVSIRFDGKGTFVAGLPGESGLPNKGAGLREITGLITDMALAGEDPRHACYRMTIRPWLWLATLNRDSRIFRNMNIAEITRQVLDAYPYPVDYRLGAPGLAQGWPKRDYVRQMWESDFAFLRRIWREWGITFFMEGPTLILCDSPGSYHAHHNMYDTIRYHAPDGARIDEEHIHRFEVSRALTAGTVTLTDYDPTRLGRILLSDPLNRYDNLPYADTEQYDWGDYAQPLAGSGGLSGTPNDIEDEARYLANVRADALRVRSLTAQGRGNLRGLAIGHTFHLEGHPDQTANAEYLVSALTLDIRDNDEASGDEKPYRCITRFELHPANRFYRNRLKKKPQCGTETAIVTGPANYAIWPDAHARVKVRFVWDRLSERNSMASCWVRAVSPWQGMEYGFAALPRVGQEVAISYHEGDPDKPYISGRMVNRTQLPPWELPKNQALTGWRSRDLEGLGANSVVTDDTPGKLQVQVTSDHANSRLVLGSNTRIDGNSGRAQARGEGFELATEAHGVARANRGMLITTETRAGADAPMKDMGETVQRLRQAREQHEDMAQFAQHHKAQDAQINPRDVTAGMKAQNDAIRGGAKSAAYPSPEMTRPDLVLASASGLAATAADSTHLASQNDHAVTAGRDVSIVSGRSLFASVRGAISFVAAQFGIRLFAAKGKVEIQAQNDQMALAALKDLTITSTDGKIVIEAAREIWIGSRGSYIQINGSGITNGTTGTILEKCARWSKTGPDSMPRPLETFRPDYQARYVLLDQKSGLPMVRHPYRLHLPTGRTLSGMTGDKGETIPVFAPASQPVQLRVNTARQQSRVESWHLAGGGTEVFSDHITE